MFSWSTKKLSCKRIQRLRPFLFGGLGTFNCIAPLVFSKSLGDENKGTAHIKHRGHEPTPSAQTPLLKTAQIGRCSYKSSLKTVVQLWLLVSSNKSVLFRKTIVGEGGIREQMYLSQMKYELV